MQVNQDVDTISHFLKLNQIVDIRNTNKNNFATSIYY